MSKSVAGTARKPRTTNAPTAAPQTPEEIRKARDEAYPEFNPSVLNDLYTTQRKQIGKSQVGALEFYQGTGYEPINKALRDDNGTMSPTMKKRIGYLDSIESFLPENTTLTRGISAMSYEKKKNAFIQSFFEAHNNGTLAGSRFNDKAFLSTSVGDTNFTNSSYNPGHYVVKFRIRAQKGKRVIIPDPKAFGGKEKEVLLHRNSTLKVVGSEFGQNKRVLIIDVDLE